MTKNKNRKTSKTTKKQSANNSQKEQIIKLSRKQSILFLTLGIIIIMIALWEALDIKSQVPAQNVAIFVGDEEGEYKVSPFSCISHGLGSGVHPFRFPSNEEHSLQFGYIDLKAMALNRAPDVPYDVTYMFNCLYLMLKSGENAIKKSSMAYVVFGTPVKSKNISHNILETNLDKAKPTIFAREIKIKNRKIVDAKTGEILFTPF
jgi:hypothetical protein